MPIPAESIDAPVTVSAVMPTFNMAGVLPVAIDSILAQRLQDWELIVVDDGSTDETQAILARYNDTRIRVYRSEKNVGRAAARNIAVRNARGQYIAICDSDDISMPDRFSTQVAYLDAHPEVDVVSSQLLFMWGDEPPQVRARFPERPADIERRFGRGQMGVAHGASMMRSSCFERCGLYCPELVTAEDFELFLRMQGTCTFRTLPESLVVYRHESRRATLRKWVFRMRCHRYALYRVHRMQQGVNERLPFHQFTRRWDVRTAIFTVDLLRFVHYNLRAYMRPRHVLR